MFLKSKLFGLALLAGLVATCFPVGGPLQLAQANAAAVIIRPGPIVAPPVVVRPVVPAPIVVRPVYGHGYWFGGRWYWHR
jgi:hypothetical protein